MFPEGVAFATGPHFMPPRVTSAAHSFRINMADKNETIPFHLVPYIDHYSQLTSLWSTSVILKYVTMASEIYSEQSRRGEGAGVGLPETVGEARPLIRDDVVLGVPRSWTDRLEKATAIIHRSFSMLLAAVIFLSLPIAHMCIVVGPSRIFKTSSTRDRDDHYHKPCLTNAASTTSVILAWIFTAMSVLWWFLELLSWSFATSGITQCLIGFASFPFVMALFFMGFQSWSDLTSHGDSNWR
ncbi:hypothetical protein HDU76_013765 [Blyttiomyces sp. JEL0837]|nr:hypothetical protein HDU76_013765 [Blyttiomyces sp. JEL0837]